MEQCKNEKLKEGLRDFRLLVAKALYNHVTALQERVESLRSELDQMETVKDKGDEELYAKLDSTYATEDENTEDEGDEAYLETFDGEIEDDSEKESDSDDSNLIIPLATNFPYDAQHESWDTDGEASNSYAFVEPDT